MAAKQPGKRKDSKYKTRRKRKNIYTQERKRERWWERWCIKKKEGTVHDYILMDTWAYVNMYQKRARALASGPGNSGFFGMLYGCWSGALRIRSVCCRTRWSCASCLWCTRSKFRVAVFSQTSSSRGTVCHAISSLSWICACRSCRRMMPAERAKYREYRRYTRFNVMHCLGALHGLALEENNDKKRKGD